MFSVSPDLFGRVSAGHLELHGSLFKFRELGSSINILDADKFETDEISADGLEAQFEIFESGREYGLLALYFLPIAKIFPGIGHPSSLHGLILKPGPLVYSLSTFSKMGRARVSDSENIAGTVYRIPDWEPPSSWITHSLQKIRLI